MGSDFLVFQARFSRPDSVWPRRSCTPSIPVCHAARYDRSEKGRARSRRYNVSEAGARRAIKYNDTDKGRARIDRYEASYESSRHVIQTN